METLTGGLVTALEPVMRSAEGAWVGWAGQADVTVEPFDFDGTHLVPVTLSASDVQLYYEGFSNDTIWPLYHDVIAEPTYKRAWWDAYVKVNQRFAQAAADVTADSGIVWVQDYQLQLVPKMLREMRPDLTIGYFHHIPFPAYGLYAQLPWRKQVLEGLLGADVIGSSGWRMPQLRPRGAPPAALRDQGQRHPRSGCRGRHPRRAGEGVPDLDRRRVVHRARAEARDPAAREGDPRGTRKPRARSCSASTASTTPRASATA